MNKKEATKILFFGLILIMLVGVVTLTRSLFKKDYEKQTTPPTEKIDQKKIQTIDDQTLSEMLKRKESLVMIDIRDEESFQFEHLVDSINWSGEEVISANKNLLEGKSYIIIDDGYLNAGKRLINDLGYPKNFYYLDGGMATWKNNGYSTISFGNPESFVDQSKINYIETEELKNLLSQDSTIVLLDLRSKELFDQEHLKGAINIPLAELELRRKEISSFGQLIVYGESQFEAFQGGVRLFDLNFFNVRSVKQPFSELKTGNLATESFTN